MIPEVTVFGEIVPPRHEDELSALRLPPKHSLFLEVKMGDIRLQNDISDTNTRWDRRSNRDFHRLGNEVTSQEDLDPKTMEGLLQDNVIR